MADKKPNALMTPVKPSPELAAITGGGPMPRSQITSKVWEYIRKHGLQDKTDKRTINPDAALGKVVGTANISMFEMTKLVAKRVK